MLLEHSKGRKKLVTSYKITGDITEDIKIIPKIIAEVWDDFEKNSLESEKLYDYFFNDTEIVNKVKTQRPDINNRLAIPRAFEIQRKINSYANGTPREYTSLDTSKRELLQIFNNYQLHECKHSKTQIANYYASICGVGYYCVLPDSSEEESTYEIFSEDLTPFNTFIVYENSFRSKEVLGVNFYKKKNQDKSDIYVFNVFTKTHQFEFETPTPSQNNFYTVNMQKFLDGETNTLRETQALPTFLGMIPIIEVVYHPFRIGIYEVVIDLIDCVNMFLSGDMDARQQAIDYVMVLTDCEFEEEVDENGKAIKQDFTKNRVIQIKTNNGTTQAKVEILTNNATNESSIAFIDLINGLIEKIVGIPTRKNQDVGGNSSTGVGAKNENGMRDLDDNADIIQAQALISEKKFIKLVLAIDKNSKTKRLADLKPIDINISFPRNEKENILVSAQAYNLLSGGKPMDIEDSLKFSNLTIDVAETAKRVKEEEERNIRLELDKLKEIEKIKSSSQNNALNDFKNKQNQPIDNKKVDTDIKKEI